MTVLDDAFPALSVASTLKLFCPTLEVSIGAPSGTVPVQVATPEPPASSAQE